MNMIGLNGSSSIAKAFRRESQKWQLIPDDYVENTEDNNIFNVRSVTDPSYQHTVDLINGTCTCYIFSVNHFCKHLFKCQGNNLVSKNIFDEEDLEEFSMEKEEKDVEVEVKLSLGRNIKPIENRDTSLLHSKIRNCLDTHFN